MWLHICQGIMLLDVAGHVLTGVYRSARGRTAEEPSGAPGYVGTVIGVAIRLLIVWKAGALTTILGS